jgi:apolipoprotein N-acyltransferase
MAGALRSAKHGIEVLWSTDSGISARINPAHLLLALDPPVDDLTKKL